MNNSYSICYCNLCSMFILLLPLCYYYNIIVKNNATMRREESEFEVLRLHKKTIKKFKNYRNKCIRFYTIQKVFKMKNLNQFLCGHNNNIISLCMIFSYISIYTYFLRTLSININTMAYYSISNVEKFKRNCLINLTYIIWKHFFSKTLKFCTSNLMSYIS